MTFDYKRCGIDSLEQLKVCVLYLTKLYNYKYYVIEQQSFGNTGNVVH